MNIFIVEDEFEEISGYLRQFENQGWMCERTRTFSDAYRALESEKPVDLFIVDMMLPWGHDVDDETERLFDWKMAGAYLIDAIRGRAGLDLDAVVTRSHLSEHLPASYRAVPIIALTKIPEVVESRLSQVAGVAVVPKLVDLRVEMLPDLVQSLGRNLQGNDKAPAPEI